MPDRPALDADVRALLEAGSSTTVGLLTPAGEPFATRGWGTRVLDDGDGDALRFRVLIGTAALVASGHGPEHDSPFAIAMTGADVPTLRSVQAKGTVVAVEPVTPEDLDCFARYCDEFFTAVVETDGTPRELLDRIPPADLLACIVEVDELYNQTPGPGAGRRLGA